MMLRLTISKKSIYEWTIALILMLSSGLFDMWAVNDAFIGTFRLRDVYFVILTLWSLLCILQFRGISHTCSFSFEMLAILFLIGVSCVTAYVKTGQPLSLGFSAQRDIFCGFLAFFAIAALVRCQVVSLEGLLHIVKFVAALQLVLNTLNWFIYESTGNMIFKGAIAYTERYGSARIVYSQVDLIALLIAICLTEIMSNDALSKSRKNIVMDWILTVWGVLYFFLVVKLRATSIAVCASVLVSILAWRKAGVKKLLVAIGIFLAAVLIFPRIPIIQDIIETLFGGGSLSTDTMEVRTLAQAYYLSKFAESPIVGWGYPHTQWSAAFALQGKSLGYNFSDNGIFSFLFIYGGLGLSWFIALVIKYAKKTIACLHEENYLMLTWGVYILINLFTGMFWGIGNAQLPFVIMIVYASYVKYEPESVYIKEDISYVKMGGARLAFSF